MPAAEIGSCFVMMSLLLKVKVAVVDAVITIDVVEGTRFREAIAF